MEKEGPCRARVLRGDKVPFSSHLDPKVGGNRRLVTAAAGMGTAVEVSGSTQDAIVARLRGTRRRFLCTGARRRIANPATRALRRGQKLTQVERCFVRDEYADDEARFGIDDHVEGAACRRDGAA